MARVSGSMRISAGGKWRIVRYQRQAWGFGCAPMRPIMPPSCSASDDSCCWHCRWCSVLPPVGRCDSYRLKCSRGTSRCGRSCSVGWSGSRGLDRSCRRVPPARKQAPTVVRRAASRRRRANAASVELASSRPPPCQLRRRIFSATTAERSIAGCGFGPAIGSGVPAIPRGGHHPLTESHRQVRLVSAHRPLLAVGQAGSVVARRHATTVQMLDDRAFDVCRYLRSEPEP